MDLIFEREGCVRVERDAKKKLYVAHWQRLNGPHYREACQAILDDARAQGGVSAYVSDPQQARDIQSQDDLEFAVGVVNELIALGCQRFFVVKPGSAVTHMATRRMGKAVDEKGVSRTIVETLEEALRLARK